MKSKNYILLLFLFSVLFVFSGWKFISVVSAFFMMPLMMLLALRKNIFFTLLPGLLWSSVLLYPVFLVSCHSDSWWMAVFSYLAINILLALPLFGFLWLYKSARYRLLSPLLYVLILYLLKGIIFQIIPVIMVFQSEWLRYIATHSVSVWLTTLMLLYVQVYVAEIIRSRSYRQTQKYLFLISGLLLTNLAFTQATVRPAGNLKMMAVPLAVALGDDTDLNHIITQMEQQLSKEPDTRMVVFSESSWLGFKPENNRAFTRSLIDYLTEKSLTDKRVYLLQTDGLIHEGKEINKVLTVKIEDGHLWYTGKRILVPGWEKPVLNPGVQTLMDNYFVPEMNKRSFRVDGVNIRPEICYEVLFMPPLMPEENKLTLVQSSYIVFRTRAGKRAYEHIVTVSNLLGWFSHSASHQPYINIQNQGGSEAISASGERDILFFNRSWNKPAMTTVIE